jgi:hypothetical protein
MNTETFLSDKFVEFSQKIAQLHEAKKRLTSEFKKLLEDHKASVKKIDDEALALATDFESWEKQNITRVKQ